MTTSVISHNYTNTPTTTNSSENGLQPSLRQVNDSRAEALVPAMAVLGVFMVVGGVGNCLVCYVIGFKLKRTPQNLLMVCLAVLDLCSCIISIPTDIVDMRFSYMFPSEAMCKGLRFIMYFISMGSGMTLIAIAVDRYRKICKPLGRQMSLKIAILAASLALFMALLLAWPAALVFGLRTIDTNVRGVSGYDCSTADKMKGTIFPLAYTLVLFSLFFISCLSIAVLYCCILCATKRHRRNILLRSLSLQTNRLIARTKISNDASVEPAEFLPLDVLNFDAVDENQPSSPGSSSYREPVDGGDLFIVLDETETNLNNGERATSENGNSVSVGEISECYSEGTSMNGEGAASVENLTLKYGNSVRSRLSSGKSNSAMIAEDSVCKKISAYDFSSDVLFIDRKYNERTCSEFSESNHTNGNGTLTLTMTDSTPRGHQKHQRRIEGDRLSIYTISSRQQEQHGMKASDTARLIDHRATLIAFLVSLVFIVSYLPYLSLQVAKLMVEGFDYDQQGAALVLYNIFLRSYYTNSIANPVIYGVLNDRFKEEVCLLLFRARRKLSGLFRCKTVWR